MLNEQSICAKFLQLSGVERILTRYLEDSLIREKLDVEDFITKDEIYAQAVEACNLSESILHDIYLYCVHGREFYHRDVVAQTLLYRSQLKDNMIAGGDFDSCATIACNHIKWLLSFFYCGNEVIGRSIPQTRDVVKIFNWCMIGLKMAINNCFLASEDRDFDEEYLLFVGQWSHISRVLHLRVEELKAGCDIYEGLIYDMRFLSDVSACTSLGFNNDPDEYLGLGLALFKSITSQENA